MAAASAACLLLTASPLRAQPAAPAPAPAAPSADAIKEAKERFARGVQLFNDGHDEAARVELERAYALVPTNWRILYNIGLVQLQLNDFVAALASFERYLHDGGAGVEAPRRAEVESRIQQLKQVVATVVISSNVPDTDIALDDQPIGRTPAVQTMTVNPGRHRISASKDGYVSDSRTISVAGSEKATVTFDLKEVPPPQTEQPQATATVPPRPSTPAAPEPPPAAHPSHATGTPAYVWVGWGVTAALAVGAFTTGIVAVRASQDLSSARAAGPADPSNLHSLGTQTKTFGAIADVCTGLAVVVGGISLYLTIKTRGDNGSTQVGLGPGNVTLRGSF